MSPRAFSAEEKEHVKRKLIEAAEGCLATTGIKKTSVDELCKAAGISKGAFYLFYESKELLFLDALEEEQKKIHEAIISEMREQKSKREGFTAVVSRMYRDFTAKPWLMALAGDEYELLLRRIPKERIERHIAIDDESTNRFLQGAGREANMDPELLSAVLRMLFMGILHKKEIGPHTDDAFLFLLKAVADALFKEESL
jgi:AcrR family transcriptional regulator